MKRLSSLKWGSGRDILMLYYQRAIKPKIEYGNAIYASASKTILSKIEVIHNTALRIATGAFRSSPINSIAVETGVMNLNWSRKIAECDQLLAFTRKPRNHPIQVLYPNDLNEQMNWRLKRKPLILLSLR